MVNTDNWMNLQLFGGGGSNSGLGGGGGGKGGGTPQTYYFIFIRPDGKPQTWRTKAKSKEAANKRADKYGREEGFKETHSRPYTQDEWDNRRKKSDKK